MLRDANGSGIGNFALRLILLGCLILGFQQTMLASQSVVLAWNASADPEVTGYKIYYGTSSHDYTNVVDVGNVTNATISGLADATTYYFAATTYDGVGDESAFSNEATFTTPGKTVSNSNPILPLTPTPTLDPIADVSVNKNTGAQTVNLSGITFSGNPLNIITPNIIALASKSAPVVKVTVATSNPSVISKPTVNYTNPKNTGTLTFKPVANAFGTATITVTVNNGEKTNNTVTKTFTVTVLPSPTDYPRISKQIVSTSVLTGKTVSLSVAATGLAPLKYQWQLNGVNIPSATSATLTLKNVKTTQAGNYSVTVSNKVGSTNSAPAFLSVYSATTDLKAQLTDNSAPAAPAIAAVLTSITKTSGQFGFQVVGSEGSYYVVQASVDLKNWVSVETNASPFLYTDTNVNGFAQRFYRAYPLP